MTQSKTNDLKQLEPLRQQGSQWGKKELFPFRRWLDLDDTERFGQKTYFNKRYFQPHVYVGVDDKEVGLELLNYFAFDASLGVDVPFAPGNIEDIYPSFNLPTPAPPLTLNEPDLSPVTYDGVGHLTVKQAGIYCCAFDFEVELDANVNGITVSFESTTRGTLFSYRMFGSSTATVMTGDLDDGTLNNGTIVNGVASPSGDTVTGDVTGDVATALTITHTFDDLAGQFDVLSGNKSRNLYINENEIVFVRFVITPTSAGSAVGTIVDSNFSLKFLRSNW